MERGIKLYRDKITTSEFTVQMRKITVQISFLVLALYSSLHHRSLSSICC